MLRRRPRGVGYSGISLEGRMLRSLLRGVGHSGLGREVSDHSEPVVASAVSPAAWAGPLAFDDSVSGGSSL